MLGISVPQCRHFTNSPLAFERGISGIKNKEKYINKLVNFIKCDTHDIEHGINGGLEKNGQEYLEKLLTGMGAKNIEKV